MIEFILAFLVLLTVVTIMSIGVIRGRPPIAGSCGGLNSLGVEGGCEGGARVRQLRRYSSRRSQHSNERLPLWQGKHRPKPVRG